MNPLVIFATIMGLSGGEINARPSYRYKSTASKAFKAERRRKRKASEASRKRNRAA